MTDATPAARTDERLRPLLARIWRDYMGAALPRLKTAAIPGDQVPNPGGLSDTIGDLLSGLGIGPRPQPQPEPAPQPQPEPAPAPQELPF